jgi:hypothetical protein
MKQRVSKILSVMVCAVAVVVQAKASVVSKAIVVESPADLPELAQRPSEAMYLQHTGAGQAVLYLEQEQGRKLAILDVTDPAKIRAIGQVSIDAPSPYTFVQDLNDSVLIHYRNHLGFAVISFKNYKQPVLKKEPNYLHPANVESYGSNGLILVSSNNSAASAVDTQQEIVNISNPASPKPLATIEGVIQRLDRQQTGTIFLLNDRGLTVVRCLAAEREHQIEVQQKNEN